MEVHAYRRLLDRLHAVRQKQDRVDALRGAVLVLALGLGPRFVALLLEEGVRLSPLIRTLFFWSFLGVGILLFLWVVGKPLGRLVGLLSGESDLATAEKVGAAFPEIRDRLLNALQLMHERERAAHIYSESLIDASFADILAATATLDFQSVVSTSLLRHAVRILGILSVGILLPMVIFPDLLLGAGARLLRYREEFAVPAPFLLHVAPGNIDVIKGQDVPITVQVDGAVPSAIVLLSKPEQQVAYDERMLQPTAPTAFAHTLTGVRQTTRYYVRSGSVKSDEYVLRVIDRPMVKMLRLELAFPRYAGIPPQQLDDNVGDVTALRGTEIRYAIESNKEIARGQLVFRDSVEIPLHVDGRFVAGTHRLMKEGSYHLQLTDKEGISNSDPIEYTLHIIPDAYPTVSILIPGANLDITGSERLPLLMKLSDDYGFSSLRLAHRLVHSRYEQPATEPTFVPLPLPAGTGKEALVPYSWGLSGLRLAPEDVVQYYVEVFDNDNVSGPKSAVSETFTLRLPSMEEVFSEVDKKHETSIDQLQDALKQSEEARKELEDLNRNVKKDENTVKWNDQKRAEELVKRYQEIQKNLNEVNRTMEQMISNMQKNQVLSKETLEKYQELQQVMEQMNSPEFADAMKRLQQSLQQVSPEVLKQALQQFSFSEENFRKSIERTLNLLKRIQIEQKVDQLVKQATDMQREQDELRKSVENTSPEDKHQLDELARQQKDIQDQLQTMEQELQDLQKRMEEFPTEMPLQELQQVMQELEKSNLQETLRQSEQMLQQQQLNGARQKQQQAARLMGSFLDNLKNVKQSLLSNQQRQVVQEMRRALEDLLELSRRQEELKNESRALEQNSQRFRQNAQEQMNIQQDLGNVTSRLSGLSQKTFSITPEMGKSIGDAFRHMADAMQSLEQRNGVVAGQQQGDAMGALNDAAQQVQAALNSIMQGGGQGMGMGAFLQRLQQLSGMQQGINDGTRELSQQRAAELARLAGEQGMVRKSLEQLAKEAANQGQLSRLLGDLNRVAQDMREVQTDLAQGNVNPETLRKQERILSRLLDSQRSMRERDYEKTRRAESGRTPSQASPPAIDLTTQEGRSRLRRDLLKALEAGYTRDYEELIRRYFEALEQQ